MKIVTAAILRNSSKEILLCRRAPGQKNAGFWEFPGGKLNEGETLVQCIERELWEELGIAVIAGAVLGESIYQYTHGTIRLVAIECDWKEGELELRVHDKLKWVLPENLLDYDLSPADIPLARQLSAP